MKTLKNYFGTKENKKSVNSFFNALDTNAMIKIKGGDQDPDGDLWPPKAGVGDN